MLTSSGCPHVTVLFTQFTVCAAEIKSIFYSFDASDHKIWGQTIIRWLE